jgi:type VI secretion system secreted protein Hcp
MAFDAFVNFGDIKGEVTDDAHKDMVMITKYAHEIKQPASVTQKTAGSRAAESVEHAEFRVTKLLDAATPKLLEAACKGTILKEVVVELWRAGGDPLKYMEIKMSDVLISGVEQDADPEGSQRFPTETIKMMYAGIEWTYTKQKSDGTAGGNVAAKWSLSKGVAA